MSTLTQPQRDILSGFRFRLPDDLARIAAAIAALQAQIDLWALIDSAYVREQAIFMERQLVILDAKAAELAEEDPFNTFTVFHGGAHPDNAGIDPEDWAVRATYVAWSTAGPFNAAPYGGAGAVVSLNHLTTFAVGVDYSHVGNVLTNLGGLPGLVLVAVTTPATVYSHGVAWDENQAILDGETAWLDLYRLRTHAVWGSSFKAARLGAGMANLVAWQSLLGDREDAAVKMGDIEKYIVWDADADESIVTPRAASTMTVSSGGTVYTLGFDYTAQLTNDGRTILARAEPDVMPAQVRVTAA